MTAKHAQTRGVVEGLPLLGLIVGFYALVIRWDLRRRAERDGDSDRSD